MADRRVFLAADLGASSGRVMAGVYDGDALILEEVHRFHNGVEEIDGALRWNVHTLFSHIKEGIRIAGGKYGSSVVSMGVATWGVDYGLLDADGQLMNLPYAYRDSRTDGMVEQAASRMPKEEVYNITGIQFMFFNTLLQLLAEVSDPDSNLHKAEHLLFTPDLMNYWLCGEMRNEYSILSTGQVLDVNSRSLSSPLLQAMGIPESVFEPIVQPGEVLGPVQTKLTEQLDVEPFNIVAVGSHDTASAVASVPMAPGESCAYLSSGTWSLIGIESHTPILSNSNFTNEGGVCNTIRYLKNIAGLWLIQECRRIWEEAGQTYQFGELVALANAAEPFLAVIDPDDPGFATPGDMPTRIQDYCRNSGQAVPEDHGAIARVILESLAFRYRAVLEDLDLAAGKRLDTLRIVGGGIQNQLLNQFTANAIGRRVITGPVEATAIGNVLMQMIASGDIQNLIEGRALVRKSFETREFTPVDADAWEKGYQTFKSHC
jgi:sugar (pentulose or hexulose) kinase